MNTKEKLATYFANKKDWEIGIVVSGFTSGRATAIEQLTDEEAENLLCIYSPRAVSKADLMEQMLLKEWRSKILAKAEKAGVKTPGSFEEFNRFMLSRSKYRKQLDAHNLEELKKLHAQLCAMHTNNRRSADRVMTKAWWAKAEQLKTWN